MIGREQPMNTESYSSITDRVWLLSNTLPPYELKEDVNNINAVLFLSNLSLLRKNKLLNKFNNKLHERITENNNKVTIKVESNNESKTMKHSQSRNSPHHEAEEHLGSQTLKINTKNDMFKQSDNDTEMLNKSNDLDK